MFNSSSQARDDVRRLSSQTSRDICKRYEGLPAFDAAGETVRITCPWVETMSILDTPTPIEIYRLVLDQAPQLSDLRSAKLPRDTDCGRFEEIAVADLRKVVCHADLGEIVSYVFIADSHGKILRMESSVNYKNIYRIALRKAIARGKLTKFYEPYLDLNTDVMVAKMRSTATSLDIIDVDEGTISFVLAAKGSVPPNTSLERTRDR
jgi:hypothetical protein